MIDEQYFFDKGRSWKFLLITIFGLILPITRLYLGSGKPDHIENISRVMSFGSISRLGIYLCDSFLYYIFIFVLMIVYFLYDFFNFSKGKKFFNLCAMLFICLSFFIATILALKAL